ncbi:MAG: FxsA family protein [Deltaproteobacteria bacterium]|nr:FxsA family protein [Deltaproteobacteria bacterium]
MFIKLLIIFTFIPILELYVIIETGRMIGLAQTVLLIFLTGIAGAWLAKTQGLATLQRIHDETMRGQMPAGSLLDGALILVGGLLLLTPGFCTDLLGFTFLAPFSRHYWQGLLRVWLQKKIDLGSIQIRKL